MHLVSFRLNGDERALAVEPRRTLLDALRVDLNLTGTKKVCDMGDCGACTVLLDGRAVYSCLTLAVDCEGREVTTIEGLAHGDDPSAGSGEGLHPVQRAFVEADAYQCGFCTPGQIMSVTALLAQQQAPSDEEIRRAVSGNLCRCGAYQNIVRAGQRAAELYAARTPAASGDGRHTNGRRKTGTATGGRR
jgi:aerobic-type carbon monoxide dehydrogenase small subunit (CoxS/CutS family)